MSAARQPVRRRALTVPGLLAVLVCLVATACTSGGSPDPSSTPTAPSSTASATAGPVTLRFAVYGTPPVVAAYRQIAAAYTRAHPLVTVVVQATPDPVTSEDHLERAFAAGTQPDLFLTRQTSLAGLVVDGRVQPVDALLEQRGVQFGDNFQRIGLEAFAADSALQCMPNDVSPYVVFYNRRLVAPQTVRTPGGTATPPSLETGWTWDQFVAAATKASHGGVKGLFLSPTMTTVMPLVRSAGADVVDDPRKPTTLTFADDKTRAALEEILTVARDPALAPTPAQLVHEDAISRFEDGQVAMLLGTRALVPELRAHPSLHFDAYPLPYLDAFKTVADITGYCIAKDSAHVSEAADFLKFASGDRASQLLAATGSVVPANLAALHSVAFTQPGRFPRNSSVFDDDIRRADPMPVVEGWQDVVTQTQPMLDRMFYAPVIDLDTLLPRIDAVSVPLLAPKPTPSATPTSPSAPSS